MSNNINSNSELKNEKDEIIDINKINPDINLESNVSNVEFKKQIGETLKISSDCLKCISCHKISTNPLMSPCCFNLICATCHDDLSKTGYDFVTCPQCRKKDVKFNNSTISKRIIESIFTKCPIENCSYTIEREFVFNHLKEHDQKDEKVINLMKEFDFREKQKSKSFGIFPIHRHYMEVYNNNEGTCNGKLFLKSLGGCKEEIKKNEDFYLCKSCNLWFCKVCADKECIKFYSKDHEHPLEFTFIDNNWECYGKKLSDGCRSGNPLIGKNDKKMRYRCADCDYNLCANCMSFYNKY